MKTPILTRRALRAIAAPFSHGSMSDRYVPCPFRHGGLEVHMPIALQHESDNIFRIGIRGTLRQSEMQDCQNQLVGEMQRLGTVRLLFVLDDFKGWAAQDNWNDLSFYVQHGDAIERIAIVGEERWRDHSLMFAAADLRKAPVGYFLRGALAQARAWLAEKPAT
jgi:SpoIIAA-like